MSSDVRAQHVYTISGVRVEFPAKAYPSQIAMMDKVIRGLQRGQHCLLESPTGSGKTLALLCASLAWQRAEAENVRKFNEEVDAKNRELIKKECLAAAAAGLVNVKSEVEIKEEMKVEQPKLPKQCDASQYYTDDDSDDDFQPTKRKKMSTSPAENIKPILKSENKSTKEEEQKTSDKFDASTVTPPAASVAADYDASNTERPLLQKQRIPKIFFGTRTHKQIAQVVKEFRRTAYCFTAMTVLASREHTCIHPVVSRSSNKNEGCRELNDKMKARREGGAPGGCSFKYRGAQKLKTQNQIMHYSGGTGWDIEDLVRIGRKLQGCPYYASRDLMGEAQIIFCPYNYLIDPRVRRSMKIPIQNNIIILDEAHNIEDSAREAAGGTFSQEDFRLALNDCEKVGPKTTALSNEIEELAHFCSYMMKWIDRQGGAMTSVGIDREVNVLTGTAFVASLSVDGFGPEKLVKLKATVDYVFEEQVESEWQDKEAEQEPHLCVATQTLLEGFLMIVDLVIGHDQVNRDDYRAVVVRTVERSRNKAKGAPMFSNRTFSLNLWCLNPAVVLKEMRVATRSIVVTSGTLSPLASYQSELAIDFKLTLEANHVIPANRVWIGSISHGPNSTLLNGTFRSTGTFEYQDELGRLLMNVCETVPHGVLCFLPSYSLLEKLVERWNNTGFMKHLEMVKTIVCESRDSSAFEETLKNFYQAIRDSQELLQCSADSSSEMANMSYNSNGGSKQLTRTGALMLAVCRGKVSEGLDFTDNNARAVVCVGIPFPNFKDTQVELKREYNDKKSMSSQLLNGSQWYEIQAFRALNQALGRCIRHKADWGAILLVDDRFGKTPRYVDQLSKWVRSSIRHYNAFVPMMGSLKQFTDNFLAEDAQLFASTQQSQVMENTISQPEPSISSSPYFVKPSLLSNAKPVPDLILLDDSDENSPIKATPQKEQSGKSAPITSTPIIPTIKKISTGTLLGQTNKMSLSQRKLAAENGSRYFQSTGGSPPTI